MMLLALTLVAYLIGSVSFAVVVSRVFALPDPRNYGSGNPGATNVLRTGRRSAAALTLLGDVGKGCLAVFLARNFADTGMIEVTESAAAVAVIVGHAYPVFYRFQGGKGVATVLGVLAGINLYLAGGAVATWVIIAFFFRISSLASLISAAFAPVFCYLLYGLHPFTAAVTAIALLIIYRHQANIRNLLAGKESRIGSSRSS
ncbi:MAG: glycerol-3-phosphate 1-O-acyltransferase PlsY [Betaproteobacteria bacterium]|nr:glycerol-3-phosphate 1-O-acyltransferase PlsY [Betaproteobacteria bacterium]MDH3436597.1 glycerol-3-phosphate 1-O-acyltransferase PlsY [Betaproteobacteria bacterium]